LKTVEHGFDVCIIYLERFNSFPSHRCIDQLFCERCQDIFHEIFNDQVNEGVEKPQTFLINDSVVVRTIDLVSGLLQQTEILMNDSHELICNSVQTRPIVTLF